MTKPDLSIDFCGVKSPNPFWLASAPPTNTGNQIMRAFDYGWGGAVFKTLGKPIKNVSSRYASLKYKNEQIIGFNNIELITDRPLELNLQEISQVKKRYPKNTLVVSLMVESKEEWREIIKQSEDAGADMLELNFGCPHGMCERGMGSAVGQNPKLIETITSWVMEYAKVPVIVKLTPNISDILEPALAVKNANAPAISLINTIKSIMSIDLNSFIPRPIVGEYSSNGGYCGPSVKPIALYMLSRLTHHPNTRHITYSGIGGISTWQDAAEFILLGATSVQVCTAVMHHGFRIIEDFISGLENYLSEKNFKSVQELKGKSINKVKTFQELDLNYKVVARINPEKCIGCNKCYIACHDGSHQCIDLPGPVVNEEKCVGCNLCELVCPVEGCISMISK